MSRAERRFFGKSALNVACALPRVVGRMADSVQRITGPQLLSRTCRSSARGAGNNSNDTPRNHGRPGK